jgi:hypothetical protein
MGLNSFSKIGELFTYVMCPALISLCFNYILWEFWQRGGRPECGAKLWEEDLDLQPNAVSMTFKVSAVLF